MPAALRARYAAQPSVESRMACRLRYWTHRRAVDLMNERWGAAISSISGRGNSDEDQKQSPVPRILCAPVGESDNWEPDSRCSASVARPLLRASGHPRIARAEAAVVSCDNRPKAVPALFQFIRMGPAVRAGQFDADRSSAVRGRFDCAGYRGAPAGLDRTSIGRNVRNVRKVFDR